MATTFTDLSSYLTSLAQVSPVGIFHTNAAGLVTHVNDRWLNISGHSAQQSLGEGWLCALHPEDRSRVLAAWRNAVQSGDEYAMDCRIVRPTGEWRYVHVRAAPVRGAAGQAEGFVGTITDLTERRAAERELLRSVVNRETTDRRLRALFEYAIDGIAFINDQGWFIEVNPSTCDLLGYSREQLLTMNIGQLATDALTVNIWQMFRRLLEVGRLAGEYLVRRADGAERRVEFRAIANVLPGTHLSVVRDITLRHHNERVWQQYIKRLEILAAIDRAILDARSPATIAEAAVVQLAQLFPADRVSVSLFDDERRSATLIAVWSREPTRMATGYRFPVLGMDAALVRSGQAFHVDDLASIDLDAFDTTLLAEGLRSYIRAPLRIESQVMGSLNISSAVPGGMSPDGLTVAQEVADRMAVAIRDARLVQQLRATTESLASMSKRFVELQERERRDISRELHDEIGQVLTALKLQLDTIRRYAPESLATVVRQVDYLVGDMVATVRRLALDLRPPLLDEFGLGRALAAHFERFTGQTGVQVSFVAQLQGKRFPLEIETAVFRVVQESLTNVARHAHVPAATVTIAVQPDALIVTVSDKGPGVGARRQNKDGAGLTGMRERVTMLGGTFRVLSEPSRGTTITAVIPLSAGAAALAEGAAS
jgi:PAS domain S-box-containing protein